MQFGTLTTYQSMEKYYNKMRTQSRTQLLKKLYRTSQKPNIPQTKIQSDIIQAFSLILNTYNYDFSHGVVKEVLSIFQIQQKQLRNKTPTQKQEYLQKKMKDNIDLSLKRQKNSEQTIEYSLNHDTAQNGQFDWVGVKSHFPNLRSIFQQILLQKVRLFDKQLTQVTQSYEGKPSQTEDLMTTARTMNIRASSGSKRVHTEHHEDRKQKHDLMRKRIHKTLEKKGFTNVLIRDNSEFALNKWTRNEEKDFQKKKAEFRENFHKNNQQTPIIFQFVKKYTKTVKARDNIYRKWEQRQKVGITPEELRYLCSTSLFLNKTLALSEKQRINKNIKSAGKELISKLEFNISQKIIETYKQFVKKVSDLRAHYYEDLTEQRKKEFSKIKKQQVKEITNYKKMSDFLKFKQIFARICKSQKMSVKLKPKIYRWVKLFMTNMKLAIKKEQKRVNMDVFYRLNSSGVKNMSSMLLKTKLKCPSSRVIKRQDHTNMRAHTKRYIPTERFHYDKGFEKHISDYNKIKVKSKDNYKKQLSGGPNTKIRNYVYVDLSKKRLQMTSKECLKAIIMIQAKWKAIYQRRIYLKKRQEKRQEMQKDFQGRLKSLKKIYPIDKKIDLKNLQNRLNRVSMRTLNVLKPYMRVVRKPINNYTAFCGIKLSLNDMKIKNGKNSTRRMNEFGKMVMENHYKQLLRSGFVLTAKQINEPMFKENGSAMWWAAKNSNVELTRIFLEGGGNPNSSNWQNSTCLHEALQNGALQVVFLLLDYGADLNIKNNKKVTALYYATPKMLKLLGLQDGSVSGSELMRDNNSIFFNPPSMSEIYPDHYY